MILEEAQLMAADLIVLGTHGRSGIDRVLLGSVTEKVLRKATCAVMTVPPADHTAAPARAGRTIICAVDFSPASIKALSYALSLGQEFEATVLLTHIIDWPANWPAPRGAELDTAVYSDRNQEENRA
jgi:nucleotide-binding universal stress UspA family protein